MTRSIFKLDKSGRSKAYYLQNKSVLLKDDLKYFFNTHLNEINKNRICLHKSDSTLNAMILSISINDKDFPMKRQSVDTFLFILSGKLELLIEKNSHVLNKYCSSFIPKNTIFKVKPLSKRVNYIECKA